MVREATRGVLGDDEFTRLFDEGYAMSREAAIALEEASARSGS